MRTSASGTTSNYGGATRLRIPAEGTADNVAESTQDRPAAPVRSGHPRRQHLSHGLNEAARPVQRINLTNKDALHYFLSTCSVTHFVTPRAYRVQVGVTF